MSKPKIYKERNPFHPSMPWRARLDGLSWPARTWRAYFGDEWVPFSVRYSIAHEVQRRLAVTQRPVQMGADDE